MNDTEFDGRRTQHVGVLSDVWAAHDRRVAGDNGVPASWPFTDDPPKLPLFVADTGEYPISGDAIRAFLHDGCPIESRFRMPELLWSSFDPQSDDSLCAHDDCPFCAPFRNA